MSGLPLLTICPDPRQWQPWKEVTWYDPTLALGAAMGVLIGCSGVAVVMRLQHMSADSKAAYIFTFAMFGCMNCTGFTIWCILFKEFRTNPASMVVLGLDGAFSSLASFGFAFAALSDCGWVQLATRKSHQGLLLHFCGLVFHSFLSEKPVAWVAFYLGGTVFGVSVYVLIGFSRKHVDQSGAALWFILLGAVVGLCGVVCLCIPPLQHYLCDWMGGYVTGLDLWYFQSDFGLACFLAFVITRDSAQGKHFSALGKLLLEEEHI